HPDPIHAHRPKPLVTVGLCRVVLGDQAAEDDTGEAIHLAEQRVEHLAADVLEVDIDAGGTRASQVLVQVPALVVDAGIEAEFIGDVIAFRGATGDTDDAAALNLGELPDDAADRATPRLRRWFVQPSPRRAQPAAHRISRRSSGRACTDRATAIRF